MSNDTYAVAHVVQNKDSIEAVDPHPNKQSKPGALLNSIESLSVVVEHLESLEMRITNKEVPPQENTKPHIDSLAEILDRGPQTI